MAKTILFDIDDTLFPSSEFAALARKNALNAMIGLGIEADFEDLNPRLLKIIETRGSNYPAHFDELCKQLKISKPARYVAAAVAAYHDTKTSIQPFPKVPLTLLRLKESGCTLHIATNGNAVKQWDKLIRLRLALYFDRVFVSEEVGMEKGREFFQKILELLGKAPPECIMVGDREDSDIEPCKELGITTVRVLSGKYSSVPSRADFSMKDFSQLLSIVEQL